MNIPQDIIIRLNSLPIEEVADKLGIEVKKHKALCFNHEDHNPSISFSISKNIYKCWVCNVGGNPIKLVREKEKCSFQEACLWLSENFDIWYPQKRLDRNTFKRSPIKVSLPKRKETQNIFDEEIFKYLINNASLLDPAKVFLFKERHLSEAIVLKQQIGSIVNSNLIIKTLIKKFGEKRCLEAEIIRKYNNNLYFCFYTPCLLFPYYDQNGNLIGVQSRYLGTNQKATRFQFTSSQTTRLYNLSILNNLKKGETLYLSEGITDCLALLSDGLNAVAIPSATILPTADLFLLKDYNLHMFPDKDDAGQKAFRSLVSFFINHYSIVQKEELPEGCKDYSEYHIKNISKIIVK